MAPRWERSSEKHGVPRGDQIHAILPATFTQILDEPDGGRAGTIRLFIGPAHAQTSRELEILVREYEDGREAEVFHAMDLGPKYRRYRAEREHD